MRRFEIIDHYASCTDGEAINLPKRGTAYSAGYDIEAAEDTILPRMNYSLNKLFKQDAPITLAESKELNKNSGVNAVKIRTGIKVYMEQDEYLELVLRSGVASNNLLIIPQGKGVIDADYVDNPDNEGEIMIAVKNLSPFDILIKKGDKIAQGIFSKYGTTYNDEASGSRVGGFGSTDKK